MYIHVDMDICGKYFKGIIVEEIVICTITVFSLCKLYSFFFFTTHSYPFIRRLDRIIGRVSLHKKSQFIPKLVGFWKLKRQSRNGVPLLRRMQANNHGQRTATVSFLICAQ